MDRYSTCVVYFFLFLFNELVAHHKITNFFQTKKVFFLLEVRITDHTDVLFAYIIFVCTRFTFVIK